MILVQFYNIQDPCLNCAPKNQKFRMFVYLLVQTKFQHLQLATLIYFIGWLPLTWIARLDESQPFTLLQLMVRMHLCLFSNRFWL
jgi:hypothetical protein